ncbi:fumarylacetoacetate hydrolase family protein [Parafrankia elaeagni]|uniref:fumarylacetoacetate hydrolase family protein n=1 Tax=Parafrankia elaeagni TaxID=222534 RepID=UPI00038166D9|nr:fumarylacetoacetate hydrolase family protein [Parafrankia elaeagni]
MKIALCDEGGKVYWGVADPAAGTVQPIAGTFESWAPAVTVAGSAAALTFAGDPRPLAGVRLRPPVERGRTIVAAGANYRSHVEELGLHMPARPAAFLKPFRSIIGPTDEIRYPALTTQLDYEIELVVIVGTAESRGHTPTSTDVLGYAAGNDVSARDLQFGGSVTGMDMFSSKALDDTSAIGPWIVTRDELGDNPDLDLTLRVNDEVRQKDRTGSMVWNIDELLAFVDARTSLGSGDLIFTGTPAGIAHASGRYLQPGDVVETTIEGVGTLRNIVGAAPQL